eukprot:6202551-Pleurochrysis_carterae.AAC.1
MAAATLRAVEEKEQARREQHELRQKERDAALRQRRLSEEGKQQKESPLLSLPQPEPQPLQTDNHLHPAGKLTKGDSKQTLNAVQASQDAIAAPSQAEPVITVEAATTPNGAVEKASVSVPDSTSPVDDGPAAACTSESAHEKRMQRAREARAAVEAQLHSLEEDEARRRAKRASERKQWEEKLAQRRSGRTQQRQPDAGDSDARGSPTSDAVHTEREPLREGGEGGLASGPERVAAHGNQESRTAEQAAKDLKTGPQPQTHSTNVLSEFVNTATVVEAAGDDPDRRAWKELDVATGSSSDCAVDATSAISTAGRAADAGKLLFDEQSCADSLVNALADISADTPTAAREGLAAAEPVQAASAVPIDTLTTEPAEGTSGTDAAHAMRLQRAREAREAAAAQLLAVEAQQRQRKDMRELEHAAWKEKLTQNRKSMGSGLPRGYRNWRRSFSCARNKASLLGVLRLVNEAALHARSRKSEPHLRPSLADRVRL